MREMVVDGRVWGLGYWLIKVPGRGSKFIQKLIRSSKRAKRQERSTYKQTYRTTQARMRFCLLVALVFCGGQPNVLAESSASEQPYPKTPPPPAEADLSGWSLKARLKIRRAMKLGSKRTDLWQFTCVNPPTQPRSLFYFFLI